MNTLEAKVAATLTANGYRRPAAWRSGYHLQPAPGGVEVFWCRTHDRETATSERVTALLTMRETLLTRFHVAPKGTHHLDRQIVCLHVTERDTHAEHTTLDADTQAPAHA